MDEKITIRRTAKVQKLEDAVKFYYDPAKHLLSIGGPEEDHATISFAADSRMRKFPALMGYISEEKMLKRVDELRHHAGSGLIIKGEIDSGKSILLMLSERGLVRHWENTHAMLKALHAEGFPDHPVYLGEKELFVGNLHELALKGKAGLKVDFKWERKG
jgi:hypothetical protein